MASRKVLYDADRASKERSEAVVVIGGQNFIQRQITMDVMTELRLLRQAKPFHGPVTDPNQGQHTPDRG